MIRLSIITLTCLISLSGSVVLPDANSDLFAAIEAQNAQRVAQALASGANADAKRTSDNLSPKIYAFDQIHTACQKPLPLLATSLSPVALIIASFLHNKTYALAILAGLGTGAGLSSYVQNTPEDEHNAIQKVIATLHLDDVTSYSSIAGLLASAWSADQLILSSVGTVGLALLYYQGAQLKTACTIYKMVDPECTLFPELA